MALQFICWYGILAHLEKNQIFQASNVSTTEAKRCLQIILLSIILAMEDLLEALRLSVNEPQVDIQQANRNLCAIWAIHRFMKKHRKPTNCIDPSTLIGFKKTMASAQAYQLEYHLTTDSMILIPTSTAG
jgi:hypothetical protein